MVRVVRVGIGLTGSVADGCVEWCANNGDVVVLIGLDQTLNGLQVGEAGNAGEGPLVRYLSDVCLQPQFVSTYLLIPLLEQFRTLMFGHDLTVIVVGACCRGTGHSQSTDKGLPRRHD
jgi:hypothetical protein